MAVALGLTGVVVGVLAAAGSAYAAYSASQAQAQQQRYQAKLAKNQAQQAQYDAQIRAENQKLHDRRVIGAQRAALGAAGVIPGEGTPLWVQMDTLDQGFMEEQRLRYGGQVRADTLISESRYLSRSARVTEELGYVNAGTSLLGGTASAVSGYRGSGRSTQTEAYGRNYNE